MSDDFERTRIDEIEDGFAKEREEIATSWNDYLCYVLEVDKADVNQDGLTQISAVVARAATSDGNGGGDNE